MWFSAYIACFSENVLGIEAEDATFFHWICSVDVL
jgi:hypothetical protein